MCKISNLYRKVHDWVKNFTATTPTKMVMHAGVSKEFNMLIHTDDLWAISEVHFKTCKNKQLA